MKKKEDFLSWLCNFHSDWDFSDFSSNLIFKSFIWIFLFLFVLKYYYYFYSISVYHVGRLWKRFFLYCAKTEGVTLWKYLTCKTSEMLSHFVFTTKTTQPLLQIVSVTRLIIWQFFCTIDIIISSHYWKFFQIWSMVMMKYSWDQFWPIRNGRSFWMNNKEYYPPTTLPFPALGWLLLGRKVWKNIYFSFFVRNKLIGLGFGRFK